ncbi:MAG: hypothetical protein WC812_04695 [Candidatus Pacearchaeota archaeon]|jgi:hypothetical protein
MNKRKKESKEQKKDKEDSILKEKNESKKHQRIIKIVIIFSLVVVALILVAYFSVNAIRNYNYNNVKFETVQEGDLILYHTSIPVSYEGQVVPYNFYLRTNPRQLVKMNFEGVEDFALYKNAVINFEKDFNCEGDGIIAIANLVQLHQAIGINLITDENATCDEYSRYLYLYLREGNETEIIQTGKSCYDLVISDCKILPSTERIMLEIFSKYNEIIE